MAYTCQSSNGEGETEDPQLCHLASLDLTVSSLPLENPVLAGWWWHHTQRRYWYHIGH